jgi:hypothetical protein
MNFGSGFYWVRRSGSGCRIRILVQIKKGKKTYKKQSRVLEFCLSFELLGLDPYSEYLFGSGSRSKLPSNFEKQYEKHPHLYFFFFFSGEEHDLFSCSK